MENNILNLKSKSNLCCTICDKCCEYRGDIKITPINVLEISKFLKVSIDEFLREYTEEVKEEPLEIVIKGIGENRNCIFNDIKTFKCKINKVKPMQCVMFPLVPVDIKRDLFINANSCIKQTKKQITVNKWINGNNNIYDKNKEIYLKWIELMEEIQPKWNNLTIEKQEKIKNVLYKKYNLKKDLRKQVFENIKKARQIFYG